MGTVSMYDAIVIGGGFYGAAIAIYLANQRGFSRIALIEREPDLLTRASFNNQARVHNGYHYPRSFTTAFRSRVNLPSFVRDYSSVVKKDFTKLYAIARNNSKVTAKQFKRFCHGIGAKLEPVPKAISKLFEPRLIEEIFLVEEYVFDANKLTECVRKELDECEVEIVLSTQVKGMRREPHALSVIIDNDTTDVLNGHYVFNCTYSGLNQFSGEFLGTKTKLKHEIAEMALMMVPPALAQLGITVMDGPFFSLMPFPAKNLHTLSHVRYTPHCYWNDSLGTDPYEKLSAYNRKTRVDRMIRDVTRYIPSVKDARYIDSLYEVKTVLIKNESDDGRPILFEKHPELPGCFSILGGKIDNIYDVLEKLDAESLSL